MVAAIHRETGGSDIGLRLALEVSGRSPKFNEQDLLRRVWPSIKNRPNALVGIGTLKVLAGEAGWIEPIEDTFDVVPETRRQLLRKLRAPARSRSRRRQSQGRAWRHPRGAAPVHRPGQREPAGQRVRPPGPRRGGPLARLGWQEVDRR